MSMPRDCGGASSETYTGAVTDVKPIPKPIIARATISTIGLVAKGASSEPTMKIPAAQTNVARRPIRSATAPPTIAPIMAPIKTMLTTSSSTMVERAKLRFTKISAAAIMPMS